MNLRFVAEPLPLHRRPRGLGRAAVCHPRLTHQGDQFLELTGVAAMLVILMALAFLA